MKRSTRAGIGLAAALLPALFAAGCGRQPSSLGKLGTARGKMLVAAGIAPMASFAKEVGGDLVQVELMVPPGASPHTYQPQPDQMKFLSRASVLVLNGIKIEFWAEKAIEAADNPRLIVVRTADGLDIIDSRHDKEHPGGNPHVWLDPINAIHQVEAIRAAFIEADPRRRADYERNAAAFIAKLKRLDADIRAQVKMFKSRSFISFHPAWVYFARRYGLTEAATIERSPGREPSPAEIREVVDTARRIRAKAIFAEPQFSPKAAEVIAGETGARVLMLDPLGKPPDYDYIKTMRDDLAQMSRALK